MAREYDIYLFDLDDTIISERDYLFAAYGQIDKNLEFGYDFLVDTYERDGQKGLFDKFIKQYNLHERALDDLLHTLRTVKCDLEVINTDFLWMDNVYICTDGNREQQQNKITCAGLWPFISGVIFTRKPETGGLHFDNALMIGDSELDRQFADNLGIDFLKV